MKSAIGRHQGELNGSEDLTIEGKSRHHSVARSRADDRPNGRIQARCSRRPYRARRVTGNVTRAKGRHRDNGSVDGDIVSPRVAIARVRTSAAESTCSARPRRRRSRPRSRPPNRRRRRSPQLRVGRRPITAQRGSRHIRIMRSSILRSEFGKTRLGLLNRLATRVRTPSGCRRLQRLVEERFLHQGAKKFLTSLTAASRRCSSTWAGRGQHVNFSASSSAARFSSKTSSADLDRHVREGKLEELPEFFKKRFPQPDQAFDGILCWDILDYLDRRRPTTAKQ